jgi:crotonobetainyl-CoA:carnitine CoA-transferase CaiB-like acyl-CoA transferase
MTCRCVQGARWCPSTIRVPGPRSVSSPLQIVGQEKVPPTLAPEIGPHTVEVLRAARIAAATIERLLQAGVIVQA